MKKFAIFLVILSFIFLFFSLIKRFYNPSEGELAPESMDYLDQKTETPLPPKPVYIFPANEAEVFPLNQLNTPYFERNLSLSSDGNTLYFMSGRGGQSWSNSYTTFNGQAIFDGDIWVAERIDGQWQAPTVLPQPLNSELGEDEPNISEDGQRLYFQTWKANSTLEENFGPYFFVEKLGGTWQWEYKTPLGGGISQFFTQRFATDGMSISRDETRLILAAGKDYDGNMDLYQSQKVDSEWSKLTKLEFSTSKDERSVFLANDGQTIYFASNGFPEKSFGGYDIYKTKLNEDGSFSEITNIGAPFNSEKDELGFVLSRNLTTAYFIREGDIFQANIIKAAPEILP
jgi:Tol biopolymer transport system component